MKKIISYGLLVYLLAVVVGYTKANYVHGPREGALAAVLAVFIVLVIILFWYIRKEPLIRFNLRLHVPLHHLLGVWYLLFIIVATALFLYYSADPSLSDFIQLIARSALILIVLLVAIGLLFIAARSIMTVCKITILDSLGKTLCAIVFGQA